MFNSTFVHLLPPHSYLWLSTTAARPISTTTDKVIWNKTTQRLMTQEQEIGTMTPHHCHWHEDEAHHSLSWWTGIQSKEAVDTAWTQWTLMDRLVREEKETTESFLLTEWLNYSRWCVPGVRDAEQLRYKEQ
jgi:hypothetical protein